MRRSYVVVLVLSVVFLAAPVVFAAGQGDIKFGEINARELKKEMDGGKVLVIDARTEQEYAQGHIPDSVNIPPSKYMFISGFLPKDKLYPIVFYCRGTG